MSALADRIGLAHLALPHLAALHLALLLSRAEEAWEPVLLGGLIPILGATAITLLLWHAIRQKPEEELGEKEQKEIGKGNRRRGGEPGE
ncbi:MAG: hypothetical protein ABW065_10570 [Solirubrobacterales bacterium]